MSLSGQVPLWPIISRLSVVATVMLLLAGILVISETRNQALRDMEEQARVQARILAESLAAPIDFRDPVAADQAIATIRSNPAVLAAGAYDREGRLFAAFSRPGHTLAERLPGRRGLRDHEQPILRGDERIGTIYLKTADESPARKRARYGMIALFVVLALILVSILAIAQTMLRRANADLSAANAALRRQIEERERVEGQLLQAQKMESLGQLTGGIAHDFNNMLAIVVGSLDLARRRIATAPELALRAIGHAMEGAERAAALTGRLLAFARRQPLAPTNLDVNALVSGMIEMLARTLGESVRMETALAPGLPMVHADRGLLESAIINLCVNARDAMPDGGQLTLATEHVPGDKGKEGFVAIAICDTGTGMDPDVAERAIEPFYTTKEVGQGTGLGLSQVYGFVKQSGGEMQIESTLGVGTCVRLMLPAVDLSVATDAAERVRPHSRPPVARPGERILVVEDEPQVRMMLVAALVDLGYETVEAENGALALHALEKDPHVALLLTDIRMPGMSGWQLARLARMLRPDLSIAFTSGYARADMDGQGADEARPILPKPFTIAQLAGAVRQSLDQRG